MGAQIATLLSDLLITLLRVSVGTTLSWLAGTAMGFLCYRYTRVNALMMPPVNFIRHIPPLAWLPLVIVVAGIGEVAVALVLLISMSFHGVIVAKELFRNLPRETIEQAKLDGAHGLKLLLGIELPLAAAGMTDLFRVLWGVGWSAAIAAEMLGVSSGMGFRLMDFRYLLRYKEMLVYIVVIGLVGVACDYALARLRSRLEA